MRLKQIKLAGFKSFVDVTTVPLPQQMTAIVGPNGCGKSNIIDAVRWVLGESSAKNLRGDSMTDVIFNGATGRKPVGQASVELIFDNTDNRIQGSMASRTEISIRRLVNRDSQNTYFLNGSKCRRKDITDIFLGTGLGPRSYAIIEQGMISKLIESKPQDLRIFIEEAAGVSKYKERRRETETRIRHTRENLIRLADIRQEMAIQLEKLHGQSQAAVRFKALKTSERKLKAELTVLRWQYCQDKLVKFNQQQLLLEKTLDQLIAKQRQAELSIVQARTVQHESSDKLENLQQQKLVLTTKITRLEQNIKHAKQRKVVLAQDVERLKQNLQRINDHVGHESEKQQDLVAEIENILPEVDDSNMQLSELADILHDVQLRQQGWQHHWDSYQQQQSQYANKLNLSEANIAATSKLMSITEQRIDSLKGQLTANNLDTLQTVVDELQQQVAEQAATVTDSESAVNLQTKEFEQLSCLMEQAKSAVQTSKQQLQTLSSTHKTLLEVNYQQADWQKNQNRYLEEIGISHSGNLIDQLSVQPGWETAVEMVLGQWLHAVCVERLPNQLNINVGLMISQQHCAENNQSIAAKSGTLAQLVAGEHPFVGILNNIVVAKSEHQALQIVETLNQQQSVICPQGVWLGNHWLKKGIAEQQSGVLKRNHQIKGLSRDIATKQQQVNDQQHSYLQYESQYQQLQQQLNDGKQQLSQQQLKLSQLNQQSKLTEQEYSLKQQQVVGFKDELAMQERALADELLRYEQLLAEQSVFATSQHSEANTGEVLQEERETLNVLLQTSLAKHKQLTNDNHQLQLQLEKAKTEHAATDMVIRRDKEQQILLDLQLTELLVSQQDNELPIGDDEQQLQQLLQKNSLLNQQQQGINGDLAKSNASIDEFNAGQQSLMANITAQRDKLSQLQVEAESYNVRAKTALEQLAEMQQQLDQVLTHLPSDAKESQWQLQLARVNKSISQLGAINLAAIDEFTVQSERKEFLDQQNNDLESALTTLASAINKIDKETRIKFKATFDQVNKDLKVLFPKVFGGGSAYLDLTGEDLLDTGVTIMARPPGKKNSTIHLLSGGEKALTALSLVFAIFRLNPAPFCMLDEVDAPLDDANVGRFCNLVAEMSKTVQFIYISHNKIAMEMASHLTGVTMHEPGVSRMVAVDIDEAVAMAEAV
ncbi:chromosome segregation protein SMC [Thalassotalea sp. 42_200_T64]|nr:chromosome segregation protein SMC [Thalassotalea sp. 42_200_T64]